MLACFQAAALILVRNKKKIQFLHKDLLQVSLIRILYLQYTTSNYVTRSTKKLIHLDEYHSLLNTANNTMPYSSSIFAKKHKHPSFAFFSQIAI